MCTGASAVVIVLLANPAPSLAHEHVARAGHTMRQPQVPGAKVHPEVEESHDRFFRRNFPDDHSPENTGRIDHPYPAVQESDAYEKDYVTDRNDDGGHWDAQMKYDNLKNKLAKEKQELVDALKDEVDAKEDLAKAKTEEEEAEDGAKKAEDAVHEEKRIDEDSKDAHRKGMTAVESAKAELEEAEKKFDECEKMLEEAKANLKAAEEKSAEKEKVEEKGEAELKELKDEELDAEKKEEMAEKKEEEEEDKYRNTLKSYEEEKEDVKKVEAELQSAAQKLRKFRKGDSEGANYNGGVRPAEPLSLVWALTVLLAFSLAPVFAPH